MQISTQTEHLMDAPLDVTYNTWVLGLLDEAWALDATLKRPKPNFNSNKG